MSAERMALRELAVERAPGLPPRLAIHPDGRGWVVVVGPNESGKTTLARALARLLWPQSKAATAADLFARVQLGDRALEVRDRGHQVSWSADGADIAAPQLPHADFAGCYQLSIDDDADDAEALAANIRRALDGGYDIATARGSFAKPSVPNRTELEKVEEARRKLERAEEQAARDEANLGRLREEARVAEQADDELRLLENWESARDARAELERIDTELEALSAAKHLRGDEAARARTANGDWERAERTREQKEREFQAAQAEVEASARQVRGMETLDPASMAGLRGDARQLEQLERERASAESELAQAQALAQRWGSLDAQGPTPLPPDDVLRRFDEVDGRLRELDVIRATLAPIRSLLQPHAASPRGSVLRTGAIAVGAVLVLSGCILGIWVHVAAWALLLPGFVLWLLAFGASEVTDSADRDLAPLRRLIDAESSRDDAERTALENELREAGSRWPLTRGLPALAKLERLRQQAADHAQLARAQARANDRSRSHDELRDTLGARLAPLHVEVASTAAGVTQQIESIEACVRAHGQASERARNARVAADDAREAAARTQRQRDDLFAAMGVAGLDWAAADRRMEEFKRFREQAEARAKAEERLRVATEATHRSNASVPRDDAELRARRQAAERASAGRSELDRNVGSIERDVRARRAGDAMETALANEQAARAKLIASRELLLDHCAASLWFDAIEQETDDRTQVAVFARARQLFADFTDQRYRLEIDRRAEGSSAFCARDALHGRVVELRGLSNGTRAQLLLAARAAFAVEEAERCGVRPPLVLDEVLATTDDLRFEAVVQAVHQLVRGGWQVIYLTSQPSDRARLRRLVADEDVAWIELERSAVQSNAADEVDLLLPAPSPRIAAPGDRTAEQYAKDLGVPALDLEQELSHQHVFHLLRDDLDLVHRLVVLRLAAIGVATEAIDRAVGERGDRIASTLTAASRERLRLRARALRELQVHWRIGRPPMIDERALREAGVSDHFLREISGIARAHAGDARALIDALREGAVDKFGEQRCSKLELALERSGHLDPRPRADLDELTRRVISAVAPNDAPDGSTAWADEVARLCEEWNSAADRAWRRRRGHDTTIPRPADPAR